MKDPVAEERILFEFGHRAEPWSSIDDQVMGGLSTSEMSLGDGVATFQGTVSLDNNGGFASVRSRPDGYALEGFAGIALRLRGDGRTYGVRLRTTAAFDGVSYGAPLTAEPDRWTEVHLPWNAFRPVFRGREVKGYPALRPQDVRTFGFIIADKQAGPFRLEIEWIKAFK